jgi:hypothetical protein
MKIGFILGDWSRNIGNAFFQLGGYHVIKSLFPEAKIGIIAEQPGYPSYWNRRGGNPENYFNMPSLVDLDYLVLMGPLFRPETERIWGAELGKILSRGTRLILLGVAAMRYEKIDVEGYRNFLKKYPPYMLISRDRDTFELLGDSAQYAFDGIDLAFFLPEVYQPIGLVDDAKPFIALNFDKTPEPMINIGNKPGSSSLNDYCHSFIYSGRNWTVQFPQFRTWFARKSRYSMYLEGLFGKGSQVKQIGGYSIIRTDHRPHPLLGRKTFRYPNMLVNDTPYPYLEVYSHAELTLSSRLHACVAALSYGKPAMLFSTSPRSRLFDRLNLGNILKSPVTLDMQLLTLEKENLLSFLRNNFCR